MTNIEQEFFEAFGIKPEEDQFCLWECKIPELENVPCQRECKYQRHDIYYPEITAEKLLELICIHNIFVGAVHSLEAKDLKEEVLSSLLYELELRRLKKEWFGLNNMKSQVRAVFEEER